MAPHAWKQVFLEGKRIVRKRFFHVFYTFRSHFWPGSGCSRAHRKARSCRCCLWPCLGAGCFLQRLGLQFHSIPLSSKGVHLKEKIVSLELMLLFLCFAFVKSGKPMDPHLNRMIIIKQLAAWKHRSFLDCNYATFVLYLLDWRVQDFLVIQISFDETLGLSFSSASWNPYISLPFEHHRVREFGWGSPQLAQENSFPKSFFTPSFPRSCPGFFCWK